MPRIFLLGRPRLLAADGREVSLPEKSYLLLALLASAPDRRLDRETARRLIWHSQTPEKRAGSLRQLLSRMEQSIGALLPPLIRSDRTHLELNCDGWQIDFLALHQASAPLAIEEWPLLHGELLEMSVLPTQGAEDWLTFERQRLADSRSRLLSETLDEPDAMDDGALIPLASRLVEIEPAHEVAYRALMVAHSRRKDLSAARKVYQQCRTRLREEFDTAPDERTMALAQRLGIVSVAVAQTEAPVAVQNAVHAVGEPRIVILPPGSVFLDRVTARVGLALLEEVTIGLSQQRGFKIIAAHTSYELANRDIDPASFAAQSPDLKFDYSIYVTIRGTDDDMVATCRLTKLADSTVLWAGDFSLDLQRIHESFSLLSRRIVMSLTDRIEREELLRPADVAPTAYRLYLEGKRLLARTDLPSVRKARQLFQASLKRCDSFAPAHAGMSRTISLEWLVRFMKGKEMLDQAKDAALLARESDPNSGRVFRELGYIALYQRRFEESLDYFQHAQDLSPNDADILADYADTLSHDGQIDRALELSLAAFRLNPLPSDHYYWQLGGIYFVQENYEKTLEVMEPVRSKPATARLLAATYAMTGDIKKANHYAAIVLENFPDFRTEHLWHFVPDRQPDYTRLLIDGLNRAGLK